MWLRTWTVEFDVCSLRVYECYKDYPLRVNECYKDCPLRVYECYKDCPLRVYECYKDYPLRVYECYSTDVQGLTYGCSHVIVVPVETPGCTVRVELLCISEVLGLVGGPVHPGCSRWQLVQIIVRTVIHIDTLKLGYNGMVGCISVYLGRQKTVMCRRLLSFIYDFAMKKLNLFLINQKNQLLRL